MELGYFTMPSHPPERGLKEGHEWDLEVIRWLDELGYKECWIGEHHTAPWEPHPSPDLLIAQSLLRTEGIVTLMPEFNVLNLLRVPVRHAVSFVTPFAAAARFAITGGFRSGADPGG